MQTETREIETKCPKKPGFCFVNVLYCTQFTVIPMISCAQFTVIPMISKGRGSGYDDISHINSGDDDLMLHKIATQTKWEIKYISDSNAIVKSDIPKTIKSLYF